jgi:CubicO group peptidase (beta-lactamase class C family)
MRRPSHDFGTIAILLAGLWLTAFPARGQDPARNADEDPRLAPGQPIPQAELEPFIDGFVTARVIANRIVGATVAVVQDGELRLAKGYGFADLETGRRVDPDETLFRIGSITKTFTYIAAMRLVEAGQLSLDDPVNDHLRAELRVPDDGFDEPIRIRDLMTHQPGFEDRALGVLFAREPADIRPLPRSGWGVWRASACSAPAPRRTRTISSTTGRRHRLFWPQRSRWWPVS